MLRYSVWNFLLTGNWGGKEEKGGMFQIFWIGDTMLQLCMLLYVLFTLIHFKALRESHNLWFPWLCRYLSEPPKRQVNYVFFLESVFLSAGDWWTILGSLCMGVSPLWILLVLSPKPLTRWQTFIYSSTMKPGWLVLIVYCLSASVSTFLRRPIICSSTHNTPVTANTNQKFCFSVLALCCNFSHPCTLCFLDPDKKHHCYPAMLFSPELDCCF